MTFFDKYTYKQKFLALCVICLLLLAATYKRVFKTTLDLQTYIQELQFKKEGLINLASDIRLERNQIFKLNKLLGKQNVTIDKVQKDFLTFFEAQSADLLVYQMDEVIRFEHPDFIIHTHRIVLRGGFLPMLKFIDKLEKEFDLARLTTISIEKVKIDQEEKEYLYTTLLLQNYENKR